MHSQKTSLWIQYLLALQRGVFLVDLMPSSIKLKIHTNSNTKFML